MTKQDFIQKVAQKSGLSARDAGKAVDAFMETVTETLKSGDSVNFTGFGKFSPSARAAQTTSFSPARTDAASATTAGAPVSRGCRTRGRAILSKMRLRCTLLSRSRSVALAALLLMAWSSRVVGAQTESE